MLLHDSSRCTHAEASPVAFSRWRQAWQPWLWSPTICQLHRSIGPKAALQPQVADLGAVIWRCVGTRPSVTARPRGPILYMVSATGLNKGSHDYVMDLAPLRQNKPLAPLTQIGLRDGLQILTGGRELSVCKKILNPRIHSSELGLVQDPPRALRAAFRLERACTSSLFKGITTAMIQLRLTCAFRRSHCPLREPVT